MVTNAPTILGASAALSGIAALKMKQVPKSDAKVNVNVKTNNDLSSKTSSNFADRYSLDNE